MTVPRELALPELRHFGTTMVAAPHPDDEALGCGGLIALLRAAGQEVHAVRVSDGSQSHPRSLLHDTESRKALRATEWARGLACLGVPASHLHALDWPDGQVPAAGDLRFDAAVRQVQAVLEAVAPRTLLLPWRRDPHPDHRATHALFERALNGAQAPRCLEYAVWLGERAAPGDEPQPGEVQTWRVDVGSVLADKQCAIACHASQLGGLITDDPGGFVLPPGLLKRARLPFELFFERHPAADVDTGGRS